MYSPRIIERNIEAVEKSLNIKLKRYDVGFCLEARERLDDIRKPDGSLKRALTKAEQEFIRNEALMSKYDFKYWAERWATIQKDGAFGGGLGPAPLWESQEILLALMSRAEDEEWDKKDRGENADGILIHTDKARQEGLSTIARLATFHRVTLWHNTRGIGASVDDKKVKNLYDFDKRVYNCGLEKEEYSNKGGLPWWMRPILTYDVKDEHLKFNVMGSHIQYEFASQGSAIGQSFQFDVGHFTELAYWPQHVLDRLSLDFFPTLPQSPMTLFFTESVAFGRSGWWYDMSQSIRKGRMPRWRYCYIPHYAIKGKYRRTPPREWLPSDITQRHADMVWETSSQYTGLRVRLDRDQMYWWESTRDEAVEQGNLADFLTNYSAVPEQGFQHSTPTIVNVQTMERIRADALKHKPVPYLVRLNKTETAMDNWHKDKLPVYRVGDDALVPCHPSDLDDDPRGIVWIWEPPRRSANYIMGIDATEGIMPWSREIRRENDWKTDNGCISVLRQATDEHSPDIQVAEYAAPVDQESLAPIANLIGRIFGGSNEDGEALAVVEIHLSMGYLVLRKMMDMGYTNHFQWQHLDKYGATNTQSYGWYASPQAVRLLWERIKRSLHMKLVVPQSEWFCEELADCIWDQDKKTANAAYGKHDDRIRALAIAEWVARAWDQAPDPVSTKEVDDKTTKNIDWQRRLISAEDAAQEMEEYVQSWLDN